MKKVLALALALCMVLSFCAISASADGKTVINVMSFTDEVPGMITKYMEAHPDVAEKYEVKTTITATTDGLYQPALDQALAAGGADAPDIYCAEAAFVLKYAQGDACEYAAAYEDLGIDVAAAIEAADIAQYTIDIGTRPSDGKLVGLGYQATGGAFIYRRSIAQDVWGNDDPEFVAEKIGAGTGNWDAFFAAAAELKEKGYAIISGVFVIVEKTLKIGDLINVAGETGIVDTIGLLSVKVHTLDNQMIRIPNSTIINSTLRNTSYFDKRRLDVKVSVSYETDMQKALDTLAKAPKYCKCDLQDPAPLVWFDGFGDSGINMTLAVWFKKDDFLNAKNQTFVAIKRVFDEAGIDIPYNKLDVKVYDSESQFIAGTLAKTKNAAERKSKAKSATGSKTAAAKSRTTREAIESESAKEYDPDDEH